ncbi:ABC transporter permease subunit [Pradoshia sp. D12]|uniref:ABC transporter permease n=1 Tax=Bacillaceae TaxID=186817 RepID=UPI001128ACDF|nr:MULTISPECIES: ABC transporter permease subunit [Bacillaceae]QFK72850.1 ABC transporter permease subunit [Pradoshia sp. D12]TPF71843.1 hypothetical protein FHY44_09980 [Bacillus sp. D12]
MISLIKNEWMKIFSKMSSYIFIGFLLVALVGSAILVKTMNNADDWKVKEENNIQSQQAVLDDPKTSEEEKEWIQEDIARSQKLLDTGINPNQETSWTFMVNWVTSIASFVTLFAVIICSASVSAEFSDGTIKQLLIRPHRRWKVLLSKYITTLLYAATMVVVLSVAGYLVGLIFFGSASFTDKMIDPTSFDEVITLEAGPYFFELMLYWVPGFLIIITMAFMLSTLFKSQAIAVGISVFILFASSTLNMLITSLVERYEWLKFVLFPHIDLRRYIMESAPMFEGATVGLSLGVLAAYYVLFIAITFIVFNKKDISI